MKNRLIALLLSVTLVLTGTATVWADVVPDETAADAVIEVTEETEETTATIQTPDVTDEVTEDAADEGTAEDFADEEAVEEVSDSEDPTEETTASEEETSTEELITAEENAEELDGLLTKVISIVIKAAIRKGIQAIVEVLDQSEAVTLEGTVYIDKDTTCGPITVGDAGLTLVIKDGVTLTVDGRKGYYAGIRCNKNANLVITSGTDDGSDPKGTGKLIVYGGTDSAAIGGKTQEKGCNITIESCIVEAHGGDYGAGIGGGRTYSGHDITINGGTVRAWGGKYAAGIGGGAESCGGTFENIYINGGTVEAYGGEEAAGIGGGKGGNANGIYITENLYDDYGNPVETKVTAYGKGGGSGIGGGNNYSGYNIKISGGTVNAYGGNAGSTGGGAGIGGGYYGAGYNIEISGDSNVHAESKNESAAIGGGAWKEGYNITISGGQVYANAYGASNAKDGAGIGGGRYAAGYRITISGGQKVYAVSGGGAGIGGGFNAELKDKDYGVSITGGNIEAWSMNSGAGIGGGEGGGCSGSITISGSTTNVEAYANINGAGIGSGQDTNQTGTITITDGNVTAKSKGQGAGIGAGKGAKSKGKIEIAGGNVTATGGGTGNDCYKKNNNGCAIGCGAVTVKPMENGYISEVKVNTSLSAKFSYNDGGTYTQGISPYNGNWATDNTHNENYSLWRDVKITNNIERKVAVTDAQQNVPTYGTEASSTYALTANYVSGEGWSIQWYDENGNALENGPAVLTVSSDMKEAYLKYDGKSGAGKYKFTITCDGLTSNEANYTVNKKDATITSGSATKIYDGTPLTCETYEVTGFIEGEGVSVDVIGTCTGSATQTEPTVEFNTFTEPVAKAGTDLNNYSITKNYGTLTVVLQLFVVTAGNYSGVYDGKEHKFNNEADGTNIKVIGKNGVDYTSTCKAKFEYKTSTDNATWTGYTETVPSIKNAGKLYVKIQATATINGETETFEFGDVYTMEVTKKNVTLTSESVTREYDGKALTYSDVSYGALAGGESFSVEPKATGTITKTGSVKNTISPSASELKVTAGSVDTTGNYTFTYDEGTLTVTPKSTPITIETLSYSQKYDGTPIDAGKAKSNFDDIKASGDKLNVTLAYEGENAVKDAGTYNNIIEEYKVTNAAGEDVTNCYTFTDPIFGTLTIEKRQVTLTSGTDLKVKTQAGDYAENTQVYESGDGLLASDTLDYSGFQKVTEVSYTPTDNTFEYAPIAGSTFSTENYDVTVETGYLMLVEEMSIIGGDQTFKYDGTEHTAPVTLIDNGQGAQVDIVYSTSTDGKIWTDYVATVPSIKDAGVLYVKAKAKKGVQEKDASYTVTVEKSVVTIVSDSATKSYDGTELTAENVTYSGDGFAKNEGVTVTYTGSQTNVGTSKNTFEYELKGNTKAENYDIDTNYGTLEVTKNTAPIAITTGSDSWVYNGTALSCTKYTATWGGESVKDGKLCGKDVLQVVPTGTITDAGKALNTCEFKVVRDGADVTDNYTFAEPECGTLEVTRRSVVINTASAEKTYDGNELTANQYTLSGDNFVEGEGFEKVNIVGTRTNAGTAENVLDAENPYSLKEGTDEDNYEISVNAGTLTVNKRKVNVTSKNAVCTVATLPEGGLTNTATCTVTGDGFIKSEIADGYPKGCGVQKTVGESYNTIEYKWNEGANTANYEFNETLGTLKVVEDGQAAVVTTDYNGTYDGKPHTGSVTPKSASAKVKYSADGGKTYTLDKAPEFTDAGEYVVYAQVIAADGYGTCTFKVTIKTRSVILKSASAEKTYDGTPLTAGTEEDYTVSGDGFVSGEGFASVNIVGTQTAAGESKNSFGSTPYTLNANTKVANYTITTEAGTLKVNKRKVTVTSGSAVSTYDACPAEGISNKSECTVTGEGFVTGEVKEEYPKGSAVLVAKPGTEPSTGEPATMLNTIDYGWTGNGNPANYEITECLGTLMIVNNSATATVATDYVGTYDGETHDGTFATALEEPYTVTYKVDGETLGAGEKPAIKDVKLKQDGSVDSYQVEVTVTKNGTPVTCTYKITIYPRELTLTAGSDEKVYDGTELTCTDYIVSGDGFITGEGIDSVNIVGEQKDAGESENKFKSGDAYTLKEGTKAANYDITLVSGKLTVTKRPVNITTGSAVKTETAAKSSPAMNSNIKIDPENGFITGELKNGYPMATGKRSTLGESKNAVEYIWNDGFTAGNYEITENLGTLKVVEDSKASAVATDYVGTYDGEEHDGTFVAAFGEPDTVEYTVDGLKLDVGVKPAIKDVKLKQDGSVDSYQVEVTATKDGTPATCTYKITIYPRSITLTAGSAEKVYDGEKLTCTDYTVSGDGFVTGEGIDSVNIVGEQKDAGESENKFKSGNAYTLKEGTKAANYDITLVSGKLTVTKRQLTLMSLGFAREYEDVPESIIIFLGSDEVVYDLNPITYDGQEHSREVVIEVGTGQIKGIAKIDGMGFAPGEGATYSNFTKVTDAGLYENKFTVKANAGTDLEKNYEVKYIYGLMRILPCEVTISSASASKKYDGTALTKTEDAITVTTSLEGNKMPEGGEVKYNVTGSQTVVGSSANTFDWTITNFKEINYDVDKYEGTLTVYDNDTLRIVVPDNKEYTYDGKPHGDAALAYIGDIPCDDATIWYSVDGGETYVDEVAQLTDVGTVGVKVYAEKYGYTTAYGSYTITVVPSDKLVIVAPDKTTWSYDGKPHGDPAIPYIDKDVAKDAKVEYSTDGGKTWSENVPQATSIGTIEVIAKATQDNYKDATVTYKLTITKAADTGDHNNMTLWIVLAAIAMLALAGVAVVRKRFN